MMSLIINFMPPPVLKIPISLHRCSPFFPPGKPKTSGLTGNCVDFCPSIAFRGFVVAKVKIHPIRKKKKRLDEACADKFHDYSRSFLRSWIMQGNILVDGKVVNKAGTLVHDIAHIQIRDKYPKYVCRGGHKLEAAIEQLGVNVSGKVALDSGLSTGGFTDCLLQYGASFVYGVDVGYGQVSDKIRRHDKVCVMERTNLRHLFKLPQKVDLVTLDLAFISILLVMPAVVKLMKDDATLVTLVKPQFEALRSQVRKGGIVKDPAVHEEVIEKIKKGVEAFGFHTNGCIPSPLKGAKGNQEFFISFTRTGLSSTEPSATEPSDIEPSATEPSATEPSATEPVSV